MFFYSENISVNLLSVLDLSWKSSNAKAYPRPYHAISFRKNGGAEFGFENGNIRVNSREMVFVPAFCEYTIKSGEESLIVIHFLSDKPMPKSIKKFVPENSGYFEQKFMEIYELWSKKQPGYEYACKSIIYKIFYETEKEHAAPANSNDIISNVTDYIHENFSNRELNVQMLADMCNFSDTYFRKLFKQTMNTTPLKYINKLRLNYALELLYSKYYTVNEISDKCGFNNVFYFSLFIKKETGFSPSEHIKQAEKNLSVL